MPTWQRRVETGVGPTSQPLLSLSPSLPPVRCGGGADGGRGRVVSDGLLAVAGEDEPPARCVGRRGSEDGNEVGACDGGVDGQWGRAKEEAAARGAVAPAVADEGGADEVGWRMLWRVVVSDGLLAVAGEDEPPARCVGRRGSEDGNEVGACDGGVDGQWGRAKEEAAARGAVAPAVADEGGADEVGWRMLWRVWSVSAVVGEI
uniref:DUF834 domain-containing protein n=1 Tax=Oryza meridionalis TaxID=40149 RepID=A0A0E0F2Q1_9ORYZ